MNSKKAKLLRKMSKILAKQNDYKERHVYQHVKKQYSLNGYVLNGVK